MLGTCALQIDEDFFWLFTAMKECKGGGAYICLDDFFFFALSFRPPFLVTIGRCCLSLKSPHPSHSSCILAHFSVAPMLQPALPAGF